MNTQLKEEAKRIIDKRKNWLAKNSIQDWNDSDTIHVVEAVVKQIAAEGLVQNKLTKSGKTKWDGKFPQEIWVNVYNPIFPKGWDIHTTEQGAVKESIGAPTHRYIHESFFPTPPPTPNN